MKPIDLSRLHSLRMDTTEAGYRMDDMRGRFDKLRDRHANGTAPRAVSAFQLFQTPENLADRMVGLAGIGPGHAVLEPSAGLGRLLRPILATGPASVHACEIDKELAGELFHTFPGVSLTQGDFLAREFPTVDRIVMNPPFHMRADVRHVRHALSFLRPGGVLVGLCLDTRHRADALRDLADHWEPVPAGAFRAEGTGVATVLFRITNP